MLFEKLMKDTKKQLNEGKSKYEVLMRGTSDTMQDLAQAYGERIAMEYCLERLAKLNNKKNKEVLELVFRLYGMDIIHRDLNHYMLYGVLSEAAAKKI